MNFDSPRHEEKKKSWYDNAVTFAKMEFDDNTREDEAGQKEHQVWGGKKYTFLLSTTTHEQISIHETMGFYFGFYRDTWKKGSRVNTSS